MFRRILRVLFAAGAGLAGAQAMAGESAPIVIDVAARPVLYVSSHAPVADPAASGKALGEAYGKILAAMGAMGLEEDGPPLAITHAFDPKGEWVFDAAIPVKSVPSEASANDEVKVGATPAGRVVKAVHVGPYTAMHTTYEKIAAFMRANGLKEGPLSWEEYVSDPGSTPPEKLITNIYYQVAP